MISGCTYFYLSLAVAADGPLLLWDILGILRLSLHTDTLASHEGSVQAAIWTCESAWIESFSAVSHWNDLQFNRLEMSALCRRRLNSVKGLQSCCSD